MESIDRLCGAAGAHGMPRTLSMAATSRIVRSGFRSILCPVDFSAQSRLALRYAAAIAKRSHGRLSILYVNDPLLIAAAGIALHDRTLAKRNLAELRRFVESTVSPHVMERARFDDSVTSGKPADEITKAAKRRRCDLIVMGTHGLTGADKLFIGSTTMRCAQRTTVPGPGDSGPALRQDRHPSAQTVVAGRADHRPGGARSALAARREGGGPNSALARGRRAARARGPGIQAPPWLPAEGRERPTGARIAHAQSRLAALAAGLRRHAAVQTRVLFGDASREIAKVAATERAGLVITTLRTPRDWFGPRRGSMSYDVLSQVTTPVLALPG